jgi:hypothetical protein
MAAFFLIKKNSIKNKIKSTNPERKRRSIKRGLTSKTETTPKGQKKEKEPAQIEIPKPRS